MPVWNRQNIVKRAVDSVLNQTFKDYELIIIDDGSKDNLKQIVEPYLCKNVKYYRISHSGVSAARNYGIKLSKGEFLAYLDSDNVWHKSYLTEMNNALNTDGKENDAAYCMYNFYIKDSSTEKEHLSEVKGREFIYEDLFINSYIDLNTFVHARKCIKDTGLFDRRLKCQTDWDFILRLTSRYKPKFVKKILVDYYYCFYKNCLALKENFFKAYKLMKSKYKKRIRIEHDAVLYTWDLVSNRKYKNFIAVKNLKFNTTTFKAAGFPYMLQIEPTNVCNLQCPLCPVGRNELNRKSEHMSFETFKSLIDDMRQYLLFLVLWDWGEPFTNPALPDMIKYASNEGIKTVTSTNAHFLHDDDYVKRILTSGLTTLIIAIDSLDEERYKIYRQQGDLKKAISGLKNVVKLKKELKSETLLNLRMVIMKQNEHEVNHIKSLGLHLGVDRFTLKTLNPSCGLTHLDEELLPKNPKYRRYKYKKNSFERIRTNPHCERVWIMSNIFSNGDVVPCCYDYSGELKVGNINEEPFSKIWNGPVYQELRKKLYYNKNSYPKCRECIINFKYSSGFFVDYYDFNMPITKILAAETFKFFKKYAITRKILSKLQIFLNF